MVRDEEDAFCDRDLVALAPTLLATARYLVRSEPDAAWGPTGSGYAFSRPSHAPSPPSTRAVIPQTTSPSIGYAS